MLRCGTLCSSLQKGTVYREQGLNTAPAKAKGKIAADLMHFRSGPELGKILEKKIQSPHLGKKCRWVVFTLWVVLPSIKDEGMLLRALPSVAVSTHSAWEGCKVSWLPAVDAGNVSDHGNWNFCTTCVTQCSLQGGDPTGKQSWLPEQSTLLLLGHMELSQQLLWGSAKEPFALGRFQWLSLKEML